MNLGYLTVIMVVIFMALAAWGAFGISKYAFRVSSGKGLAVLLFPPYTFYFAFKELQEEGKEGPITFWLWGAFTTVMLLLAFWGPINLVLTGNADQMNPNWRAEMEAEYGAKEFELKEIPDVKVNPAAKIATTNNAVGTNNAAGTNTAPGTNNAVAPGAAAAPGGAAAAPSAPGAAAPAAAPSAPAAPK